MSETPRSEKEREYLAYIEQHIKTVQSVWLALQEHLNGLMQIKKKWFYIKIRLKPSRTGYQFLIMFIIR